MINHHFLNANGDFDSVRLTQERKKYLHKLENLEDEYRPQLDQVSTIKAIQKALSSVSEEDIVERATMVPAAQEIDEPKKEITQNELKRKQVDLSH